MSDERHAFVALPWGTPNIDRKIIAMRATLDGLDARLGELAGCVPGIHHEVVRAEAGRVEKTGRLAAALLRQTFESAARAGGDTDVAMAFARAVEDLRDGVGQIAERVDAAEEVSSSVPDGLLRALLVHVRQTVEAFWHLFVLLLRESAENGLVEFKFED